MTAKDFLQQAFIAHKGIEAHLEQLTKLQAVATRTTTVIRNAPGGSNSFGSHVENAVIDIQDLMARLADEIARLIEVTKKVSDAIAQVPNANERAVLEFRYLCFFSWSQIAVMMKTGVDNVWRLHRCALKKLHAIK